MEDWYSVSRAEVIKHGGGRLLRIYPTVGKMVQGLFLDYPWDPSAFKTEGSSKKGFWSDLQNHKQFVRRLGNRLGIKEVFV